MGKANRPLVLRIRPGQTEAQALEQAKHKTRFTSRKRTRVMVIRETK